MTIMRTQITMKIENLLPIIYSDKKNDYELLYGFETKEMLYQILIDTFEANRGNNLLILWVENPNYFHVFVNTNIKNKSYVSRHVTIDMPVDHQKFLYAL